MQIDLSVLCAARYIIINLKTIFMRQNFLFTAVITALCAISCSLAETEAVNTSSPAESVTLEVSLPAAYTKLTDTGDETGISGLQVFVFNGKGDIDAYASGGTSSVSLQCPAGDKLIAAVVNAPDLSSVSSEQQLEECVSLLSDNGTSGFVMYGSKSEFIAASSKVEVEVSRLVARISIHKITNALAVTQHRDKDIEITGIYLVNAAGDGLYCNREPYQPAVWHNWRQMDGSPLDLISDTDVSQIIGPGESYGTSHYFYCYPNPSVTDSSEEDSSPRYTRLVVETVVSGNKYYYPVSIEGVEGNRTYEINELKITRLGSDSPDIPVSVQEASFTVTVAEWQPGTSESVEI